MTLELIITLLLFFLLILSGGAMLYIAKTSPTDGQTFQVFAGAMHDLLGAFLTLIVPRIFGMLKPVASNGTGTAPVAAAAQAQPAQEAVDKQGAVKP